MGLRGKDRVAVHWQGLDWGWLRKPLLLVHLDPPSLGQLNPHPAAATTRSNALSNIGAGIGLKPPMLLGLKLRLANRLLMDH
jgi:hypothetical protein